MNEALLDEYIAAWIKHADVTDGPDGEANLNGFLATLSPDVVYEDVPSGGRYEGLAGATAMSNLVSGLFDMHFEITSAQAADGRFAFEYDCEATVKQTGDVVTLRAVAVGTFADGKVTTHRDYYDRGALATSG